MCPNCGAKHSFTEARQFNLMFKTYAGPVEGAGAEVYLRPETAQGMFVNFKNVLETSRKRPPFGIAQVGKSFRNEITPGNFVFRTREFEQMEMEYFVPPAESQHWYEYWCRERLNWYLDLGMPADQLRLRAHDEDELSHYSSATSDVEYLFPWGWDELEGIANRGDYDLTRHQEHSGERLEYFDQAANERYLPHVIEPAAGATRTAMAFLMAAYDEEEVAREGQGQGEVRTVLRFHPRIAPYKVAVLPLSKKAELQDPANEVLGLLQPHFMCDYDETQAIGRRYRRQDELGTPFCVTVDFETLEDRAVTVRDRDTMAQDRVPDRRPARPPAPPPRRLTPRRSCARHDGEAMVIGEPTARQWWSAPDVHRLGNPQATTVASEGRMGPRAPVDGPPCPRGRAACGRSVSRRRPGAMTGRACGRRRGLCRRVVVAAPAGTVGSGGGG